MTDEAITPVEAKALLELVNEPTIFLSVHGWDWTKCHTRESDSAFAKLCRIAGMPVPSDNLAIKP
jgi:hypothetical protein